MDQNVEKMRNDLLKRLSFSIASQLNANIPSVSNTREVDNGNDDIGACPISGLSVEASRPKRIRRRSDHHAYRHRIMQVLAEALMNPVKVEWNIKAYASATPASRARNFPHPKIGHYSKPSTLVDVEGIIIMWYLPQILPNKLHNNAINATKAIDCLLSGSIKAPRPPRPKSPVATNPSKICWRVSKRYLMPSSASRSISAGSVNFSGGWFAQGHTTAHDVLKPSYNLRTNYETKAWLDNITSVEQYINVLLSLTHPRLYDNGKMALDQLRLLDDTKDIATTWSSVFTGIGVIANRTTPSHTDRGGRACWYDTLLNIGTCPTANFQLPDLGATFSYPPGTVINLCGNILKHKVSDWGNGDRVCYAHFMRRAVLQRLNADGASWVNQVDFEGLNVFLDHLDKRV